MPVMLVRGRQLIKGAQFSSWRTVGHAAQACRIHAMRGVDELVLLDIGATPEGRGPDLSLVEELSEACFMPLAVGGGVRSLDDAKALLRAGADKVVIGTGGPKVIAEVATAVGNQAVVAALDVKDGYAHVRCGTTRTTQRAIAWARCCESHGAGEILLTAMDREGTLDGYDQELVWEIAAAVSIPVIANGGCGSYEDMRKAIIAGASGVAAGAFFQFTDATPKGAAEYLQEHGIEVRL